MLTFLFLCNLTRLKHYKRYMKASINGRQIGGWQPRQQNVSIGIKYDGIKLDIVPSKIQQGYRNYHSIYKRKQNSWTQTNVSMHVDTVINSGRTKEIKAIKIWRILHRLDFPSFYLELFVLDALRYRSLNQVASNVMNVLNTIADSLSTTRLVDPANSNNVISDDLTYNEKQKIAKQARESACMPNWGQIIRGNTGEITWLMV